MDERLIVRAANGLRMGVSEEEILESLVQSLTNEGHDKKMATKLARLALEAGKILN